MEGKVQKPPEGVFPFDMSNTQAEKNGLKTGPGMNDLVSLKLFSRAQVMAEILQMGFMSAFHPCEEKLTKECSLDEFVIACDVGKKYGEKFLLLHTIDTIRAYKLQDAAKRREQKAREDAEKAAQEATEAEYQARKRAVWVEKPVIASEIYESSTVTKTEEEVKSSYTSSKRPPIHVKLIRNTPEQANLSNLKNVSYSLTCFAPRFKTDEAVSMLKKREIDRAVQVSPMFNSVSSQTIRFRKVNKTCQYETLGLNDFSHKINEGSLIDFLKKVLPKVELALQKNNTYDVLSSPFPDLILDEDSHHQVGAHVTVGEEALIGTRNFCDIQYMKGKEISCISWMPFRTDVVAAAIKEPLTHEERLTRSATSFSYYVVIWKFSDWAKPMMVLGCSQMCQTLKFCPTNPHILVAGCEDGKVIMWNLKRTENEETLDNTTSIRFQDNIIWPYASSNVDFSHAVSVKDMLWFPPSIQMNAKGEQVSTDHNTNESNQFITCAENDIYVWDVRYQEILDGKFPFIAKGQDKRQRSVASEDLSKRIQLNQWIPVYRLPVTRINGRRTRSIECFIHPWMAITEGTICLGTNDGFLAMIDWHPPKKSEVDKIVEDKAEEEPFCTIWAVEDHFNKVLNLHQNPLLPNILASISSWGVHVWNIGSNPIGDEPLFSSPHPESNLSVGRWSPTRPGMLFLGKDDGTLDIWDFSEPAFSYSTYSVATTRISSLEFLTHEDLSKSLLAIGDAAGNLHIFELSKSCTKASHGEAARVSKHLALNQKKETQMTGSSAKVVNGSTTTSNESLVGVVTCTNIENAVDMIKEDILGEIDLYDANVEKCKEYITDEELEKAYNLLELEFREKLLSNSGIQVD